MGSEQEELRQVVTAIAFVGRSGAGKTTLIAGLLPRLKERGLRVGYLKCAHHELADLDKDSERTFRAGAERAVVLSPGDGMLRFRAGDRPDPEAALARHFDGCDLVLVEGFKHHALLKKVEVRHGEALLPAEDPALLAVVSDEPDRRTVPRFARDDLDALARFVADKALGRM